MSDESFPKRERLRKRADFKRVEKNKISKLVTEHLIIIVAENDTDHSRIGVTVSKKVGNAVRRNRVKRLLRELYRKNKIFFKPGYDYVLIARYQEKIASQETLFQEIKGALHSNSC